MRPEITTEPRYSHLLEVLDGAASLHVAIRQAEEALLDGELEGEERSLLESVLDASREKHDHLAALLRANESEMVEAGMGDRRDEDLEWTERILSEAGRAAEAGSEDAVREAARAMDRLGRALRLSARESIETFLSHASPLLRAVSLKVLALHWRLRDYTDRVLWTLASDLEADCRRAAALSLGSMYEGTRDRAIGRDLVAAMTRADEESDVRWASYYALLDLDGRAGASRPLPVEDFDPTRDADPAVIARYAAD